VVKVADNARIGLSASELWRIAIFLYCGQKSAALYIVIIIIIIIISALIIILTINLMCKVFENENRP